jgi:thiol-disulfide isomerase/thioredoxin
MTTTRNRKRSTGGPNRTVLAIAAVAVAVVVAVGLAIALGGDDGGDVRAGDSSSDDGGGQDAPLAFAPVSTEGTALAPFDGEGDDPAIGQQAPRIEGQAPDASAVAVDFEEPTLLVFLAHWCPHCQRELPLLVDMAGGGAFEGIRTVAVLTGTNENAPNFPPAAWLEEEGWTGDVVVDDRDYTAAAAYGLTSYPYLVAVDAEGEVVARTAGEQPPPAVAQLVEAARTGEPAG